MKIIDLDGNWVGLSRVDGYPYNVDNSSNLDGWKMGFDIAYHLIFNIDAGQKEDHRLKVRFREAFSKAFGMPDDHYNTQEWPGKVGDSVFWRVYWDRQAFDITLLKKCEENLDECAEQTKTRVLLLDSVVIPRSVDKIAELVEMNHHFLNS